MRWSQAVFAAMLMAASGTGCLAQVGAARTVNPTGEATSAAALFDIGVSGYQALTQESSGNGTQQTPTNSAGGMLELRYIAKPVVGLELALSYNEANQVIHRAQDGLVWLSMFEPRHAAEWQSNPGRTRLCAVEEIWAREAVCGRRVGILHYHPQQQRLRRRYGGQAGLRRRWRRRLERFATLRGPASIPR